MGIIMAVASLGLGHSFATAKSPAIPKSARYQNISKYFQNL
jgi:hypothetical protein